MQPLLRAGAVAPVNRLILGDKNAGKNRKGSERQYSLAAWPDAEDPNQAEYNRERVEGVPDPLPARQPPSSVKPEFVGGHAGHLKKEWQEKPM